MTPLMMLLVVSTVFAIPQLIIDTDMSSDVDDVGAVCIANAMADNLEVNLLAVVHNTGLITGVGAISTILTYFNRSIPIGAYKGTFAAAEAGPYVNDLVAKFPSPIKNSTQVPDAVAVYREVLAVAAPGSVTIASIGFTTNLEALLASPPDSVSPLTGAQLVASRVAKIAWMGGKYPSSAGQGAEWNFSHDGIGPSTKIVADAWPNSSYKMFNGFEVGVAILTGGIMSASCPAANPCRQAYIDFNGYGNNRPSWDPLTVLYSVRGLGAFWMAVTTGANNVSASGDNAWVPGTVAENQGYLVQRSPVVAVAAAIDALLVQPPVLSRVLR